MTGTGTAIGISRSYHLVVRKLPTDTTFNENWLKKHVQEKLPDQAKITDVRKLVSKDEERLKRSKTATFKLCIQYNGRDADLYRPEIYPLNSEVKRFRFLREVKHNSVHCVLDGCPSP